MVQHPRDARIAIAYGWDGRVGYHAELLVESRVVDSRHEPEVDCRRATRDVIAWMIDLGFFEGSAIDDAIEALDTSRVQDLPPHLRLVVDVVLSFRERT